MPATDQLTTADMADRHRRITAFAMLAISVMYVAKAAESAAIASVAPYVEPVQIAMALLAVGLILPFAYWKLRRVPAGERHALLDADGFVMDALVRAQKISWAATFLVLMFVDAILLDQDSALDLPGAFYLQVTLAIMLGVASIAFLVLSRTDDTEDMPVA